MSAAKHTPGPWTTLPDEGNGYLRIRGTRLGMRFKVANVLAPKYNGQSPREDEESEANAILIAAAPELLAQAQCVVAAADADDVLALVREVNVLRAAIAKATGSAS